MNEIPLLTSLLSFFYHLSTVVARVPRYELPEWAIERRGSRQSAPATDDPFLAEMSMPSRVRQITTEGKKGPRVKACKRTDYGVRQERDLPNVFIIVPRIATENARTRWQACMALVHPMASSWHPTDYMDAYGPQPPLSAGSQDSWAGSAVAGHSKRKASEELQEISKEEILKEKNRIKQRNLRGEWTRSQSIRLSISQNEERTNSRPSRLRSLN